MDTNYLIGYILAVVVGTSLGLIGAGGSILSVPILVYIMGVEPVTAIACSLFIVGTTSLVGGIRNAFEKRVDFKTVIIFGIPSIVVIYLTRSYLLPLIPETIFTIGSFSMSKGMALMVVFAIVMLAASLSMIRSKNGQSEQLDSEIHYNYPLILLQGIGVGLLTGTVGAGGGFLIIPALVLLAKMPMKKAVGTSLFIVAINTLTGFAGDFRSQQSLDWTLLLTFSGLAIVGIFIGIALSKKVSGAKLKTAFGWFVLVMSFYILTKELLFR